MTTEIPRETTTDDNVAWLSDEQQDHWRALIDLLAILPPALDAQLKRDAGLNSYEYQVMAALSESRDHELGLSDLATRARCSLSRLSHALTRLERNGWVERFQATEPGGRRMRARLTDDGMTQVETIAPGHVREVRRLVIDTLSDEQLAALADAARAITAAALDPDSESCREIAEC